MSRFARFVRPRQNGETLEMSDDLPSGRQQGMRLGDTSSTVVFVHFRCFCQICPHLYRASRVALSVLMDMGYMRSRGGSKGKGSGERKCVRG